MSARAARRLTSWRLRFYRLLTRLSGPLVHLLIQSRLRQGKEDRDRLGERFGRAGRPRPPGPLVWIHGASVGESLSALPIIDRIQARFPGTCVLVTTGTLTSATLLSRLLPAGAFHQFIPVDLPSAVTRFLDHWQPDVGLIMESELWPNLIVDAAERKVPMALLNARISEQSFARWLKARRIAKTLLSAFDVCLAQDTAIVGRLESLGARNVSNIGNLKFAAPPLSADEDALETMRDAIGKRKIWLAAQTHEGEESIIGHVHAALKETESSILTILVPRHPARAEEIADLLRDMGHRVALRSKMEPITSRTDVYIADTLGELGLFYRLADIVFVGGSLVPEGGHNPLEPARLNCAIIHGPYTENNFTIFRELAAAGAAISVVGKDQLAREVSRLFADPGQVELMADAAYRICSRADGVIARAMAELEPLIAAAVEPGDVQPGKTALRAHA
jgi:3-deoxy-D-manno-octulosonic-acid transferase